MNKYKITINHEKTYIRKADCCGEAVRRLCLQYKWNWDQYMIDAKTKGIEWGKYFIDKKGGINYSEFTVVERVY